MFGDTVQVIPKDEKASAVITFKSGQVLNCYNGLLYDDVYFESDSDI